MSQRPQQLGFTGIRRADQRELPPSFTIHNERITATAFLGLLGLLPKRGHLLFQVRLQLFRSLVLRDRRHHFFEGGNLFRYTLSLLETLFRFDVLRREVGGHVARITKRPPKRGTRGQPPRPLSQTDSRRRMDRKSTALEHLIAADKRTTGHGGDTSG